MGLYHWRPVVLIVASGSHTLSKLHPAQLRFLFLLNDYPSGLNYYYFISTLVSVVTTIIMRKMTNEEALLAQLEANRKDPKKMKKTGFAARLEAMQKQQEQMMKEKQNRK